MKIISFLLLFLILCTTGFSATTEEMKELLNNNIDAIEVNKRILEKFDRVTEWFIALNDKGYLVVIPMNEEDYNLYQILYNVEMLLIYTEKYSKIKSKEVTK